MTDDQIHSTGHWTMKHSDELAISFLHRSADANRNDRAAPSSAR
jgi:hypothetical protein